MDFATFVQSIGVSLCKTKCMLPVICILNIYIYAYASLRKKANKQV